MRLWNHYPRWNYSSQRRQSCSNSVYPSWRSQSHYGDRNRLPKFVASGNLFTIQSWSLRHGQRLTGTPWLLITMQGRNKGQTRFVVILMNQIWDVWGEWCASQQAAFQACHWRTTSTTNQIFRPFRTDSWRIVRTNRHQPIGSPCGRQPILFHSLVTLTTKVYERCELRSTFRLQSINVAIASKQSLSTRSLSLLHLNAKFSPSIRLLTSSSTARMWPFVSTYLKEELWNFCRLILSLLASQSWR